jgi:hypothetical protein
MVEVQWPQLIFGTLNFVISVSFDCYMDPSSAGRSRPGIRHILL